MSGLSEPSLRRLAELEAKPELERRQRGELRAMAYSQPTPEQADRVERLLSPPDPAGVSAAFRRGVALAAAANKASRRWG